MYVGVSKVTERGQITIPESLRKGAKITTGSEVAFFVDGANIRIVPQSDLDAMFAHFEKVAKQRKLTRAKVISTIKKYRSE